MCPLACRYRLEETFTCTILCTLKPKQRCVNHWVYTVLKKYLAMDLAYPQHFVWKGICVVVLMCNYTHNKNYYTTSTHVNKYSPLPWMFVIYIQDVQHLIYFCGENMYILVLSYMCKIFVDRMKHAQICSKYVELAS